MLSKFTFIMALCIVFAQAANAADISPVVLDSKNSTGSTVGLDYNLNGQVDKTLYGPEGTNINVDTNVGSVVLSYRAKGTIAASAERNPNNFLDLQLNGTLRYATEHFGTINGGLLSKYESDQSFKNKNLVYGLQGTYGKYPLLAKNDFFQLMQITQE